MLMTPDWKQAFEREVSARVSAAKRVAILEAEVARLAKILAEAPGRSKDERK